MADFTNRKILYTGAAGGLGLPGVLAFLDRGATVVVLDRDPEKIHTLKERSQDKGGQLIIKSVDLSHETQLRSAVSEAMEEVGGIDTLINNAAIYPSKPFDQYSLEEYQLVQKVNVESAVICTQMVLPYMKASKFGRIVNITSITFSGGLENLSPYVASKGTLLGLSRVWAREFGLFGITSNCIAPGAFPTDAEKIHPNPEEYTKFVLGHQSVKRRGTPLDIVNAILFLVAEESGFITGQSLNVDGGWVMQ
ncbi:MAG: SDR family oxidoreductase [Actinomycetota bacterium]